MQCQNRFNKLEISKVFYGRDDTTICSSRVLESKKRCNQTTPNTVIEKVKLMCSGENRCKIPVTPEFLEMKNELICPDIRKYLKVFYTCRQNAKIHEACTGGCSSKCYPQCSETCCNPSSLTQTLEASHDLTMTCPGNCAQSCAPMCQPTCCQSFVLVKNQPLFCPNGCQSSCAPLCSPGCCMFKTFPTANLQNFRQPVPKLQYDVYRCDNGCNKACAPLCQPTCCESHRLLLEAAQHESSSCPNTCVNNCGSNCPSKCCKNYHYPLSNVISNQGFGSIPAPYTYTPSPPAQPLYQQECASPCSPACAPLCTSGCCSGTEAQPSIQVAWCPSPCSSSCAPACHSACCNPQSSSSTTLQSQQQYQYVIPQQYMQAPQQYMQAPQQYMQTPQIQITSANSYLFNPATSPALSPAVSSMFPIQTSDPYKTVSAPPIPPSMPNIYLQQQPPICPVGCGSTCMNYCPQFCCRGVISKVDLFKSKELLQRKKYQQMLANFRAKQIQKYYQG